MCYMVPLSFSLFISSQANTMHPDLDTRRMRLIVVANQNSLQLPPIILKVFCVNACLLMDRILIW